MQNWLFSEMLSMARNESLMQAKTFFAAAVFRLHYFLEAKAGFPLQTDTGWAAAISGISLKKRELAGIQMLKWK